MQTKVQAEAESTDLLTFSWRLDIESSSKCVCISPSNQFPDTEQKHEEISLVVCDMKIATIHGYRIRK